MKQLYVLLGGVGLLLLAWFWMGPKPTAPAFAIVVVPKDPTDLRGLALGAGQLWAAEHGHFDPRQVVAYLRLLAEKLDDRTMGAVAAPAFHAWRNHRLIAEQRPGIQALNEVLLPRLFLLGALEELEGLIRAGNEKAWDAEFLERQISALLQAPLEELEGSRQALLIAASVRAGDLPRAQKLLGGLTWKEGAPAAQRSLADQAAGAVRFLTLSKSGLKDARALVREWTAQRAGLLGASSLCLALEDLVLALLKTDVRVPGVPPLGTLVADSAGEPGADRYWGRVAERFAGQLIQAAPVRTRNFSKILNAAAGAFSKPGFAYPFWMRAAGLTEAEAPDDPLRAAEYYRQALVCAVSDADRARALRRVAPLYVDRLELAKVRKIAEETLAAIQDSAIKKDLQPILEDLIKKQALDSLRVKREQKDIEDTRKRGALEHYRDRLKAARDRKAPAAEIANLEGMIKDLQRQLTE